MSDAAAVMMMLSVVAVCATVLTGWLAYLAIRS